MLPTVLCLARNPAHADQVLARLKTDGIPDADISVIGVPKDEKTPLEPVNGFLVTDPAKTSAGVLSDLAASAFASLGALVAPSTQASLLAPVVLTASDVGRADTGATPAPLSLVDYELPKVYRDHYLAKLRRGGGYLLLIRSEDDAELTRAESACAAAGGVDVARVQFTVKFT